MRHMLALSASLALLGFCGCDQNSSPTSTSPKPAGAATTPTGTSGIANPERNRPPSTELDRPGERTAAAPATRNLPDNAKSPDNTAQNSPDRHPDQTKTPEDQSNASANIELTAEIRRAVMADKALSMNAKNCKIIADSTGSVTLRGVVTTQTEKDAIESYARSAAGVTWIDNQLEVKSP